MAVERVEALLRKVTGVLDGAGIPYAVIGGNAVAAWVGSVDEHAVRATKDVDVLVRRADFDRLRTVLEAADFEYAEVLGVHCFMPRDNLKPSAGMHLLFAGEKIKPHDALTAPGVERAVRSTAGFMVIDLTGLLTLKLLAFRDVDRVHIRDLLRMGLIDEAVRRQLPGELDARLQEIINNPQ